MHVTTTILPSMRNLRLTPAAPGQVHLGFIPEIEQVRRCEEGQKILNKKSQGSQKKSKRFPVVGSLLNAPLFKGIIEIGEPAVPDPYQENVPLVVGIEARVSTPPPVTIPLVTITEKQLKGALQKQKPKPVRRTDKFQDLPVSYEWTDDELVEIHYRLLKHSCERLEAICKSQSKSKGKKLAREKNEILNWIFFSELPDEVERVIDGELVRILIPFTFGACCRLEGADPSEMREMLKNRCRKAGIAL